MGQIMSGMANSYPSCDVRATQSISGVLLLKTCCLLNIKRIGDYRLSAMHVPVSSLFITKSKPSS